MCIRDSASREANVERDEEVRDDCSTNKQRDFRQQHFAEYHCVSDFLKPQPICESLDECGNDRHENEQCSDGRQRFAAPRECHWPLLSLSLIHISEPTRQAEISYA